MYKYTNISRNLNYLRKVIFGTHVNAVARMKPCVTSKQLGDYCLAYETPTDTQMRNMESHLDLPSGWIERDIETLSKMSNYDFNLVQLLLKQPMTIREAVKTLLSEAPIIDSA